MNISCRCQLRSKARGSGREGLTAARVMTKAALLEHMEMSGSCAMIFLTLDTVKAIRA